MVGHESFPDNIPINGFRVILPEDFLMTDWASTQFIPEPLPEVGPVLDPSESNTCPHGQIRVQFSILLTEPIPSISIIIIHRESLLSVSPVYEQGMVYYVLPSSPHVT